MRVVGVALRALLQIGDEATDVLDGDVRQASVRTEVALEEAELLLVPLDRTRGLARGLVVDRELLPQFLKADGVFLHG